MSRDLLHTVTMTPRLVLAIGLALTSVVLALAVLVGIMGNQRELSEVGSRVLTACVVAMAGALGFEMGSLLNKGEKKQ
jgi:hypothetical protein